MHSIPYDNVILSVRFVSLCLGAIIMILIYNMHNETFVNFIKVNYLLLKNIDWFSLLNIF